MSSLPHNLWTFYTQDKPYAIRPWTYTHTHTHTHTHTLLRNAVNTLHWLVLDAPHILYIDRKHALSLLHWRPFTAWAHAYYSDILSFFKVINSERLFFVLLELVNLHLIFRCFLVRCLISLQKGRELTASGNQLRNTVPQHIKVCCSWHSRGIQCSVVRRRNATKKSGLQRGVKWKPIYWRESTWWQ